MAATLASSLLIGFGCPKTGAGRPTPRWLLFVGLAFATSAFVPALLRFVSAGQLVLFTTYLYSSGFVPFLLVNLFMKSGWNIERGLVSAAVGGAATHWSGIVLTMLDLTAVSRLSGQAGVPRASRLGWCLVVGSGEPFDVLKRGWYRIQPIAHWTEEPACFLADVRFSVDCLF